MRLMITNSALQVSLLIATCWNAFFERYDTESVVGASSLSHRLTYDCLVPKIQVWLLSKLLAVFLIHSPKAEAVHNLSKSVIIVEKLD